MLRIYYKRGTSKDLLREFIFKFLMINSNF